MKKMTSYVVGPNLLLYMVIGLILYANYISGRREENNKTEYSPREKWELLSIVFIYTFLAEVVSFVMVDLHIWAPLYQPRYGMFPSQTNMDMACLLLLPSVVYMLALSWGKKIKTAGDLGISQELT